MLFSETTTQNEVSSETSSLSDSFGPNDNLTTIAIASSDSTVSDGYLHPVTGSQLEGSVSDVTHHHAAPPSASGVAASDDPVTRCSQNGAASENYLHPVASKGTTVTATTTAPGLIHDLAAPGSHSDAAASDTPVPVARSSQNVSAPENFLLPVASKTKKVTDTTPTPEVNHHPAASPTPRDDAASDNPVAKSSQNISQSENYLHPVTSKTKKVTGTTTTGRMNLPLVARSSKDGSTSNDALASSQQPFFHQL